MSVHFIPEPRTAADWIARGHTLAVAVAAEAAGLRRASFIASASPVELELLNARLDVLGDYALAAVEFSRG